jgi:CRISPR/Cas system-associated exonuclease Cas4 (RecB family)
MGRVIPASYSSISNFETCPRKHYLTRVAKRVKEPEGEALRWGNTVHTALEKYLRDGAPLPKGCVQYQPFADKLANKVPGAQVLVEQQLAVNVAFQPTGWWDKDAWFRGKIDVALVFEGKAWLFDWKTGKKKDDHDQLQMFAALFASHHPEVETFDTAYIWLESKQLTRETFTRDEARTFWADLVPRVERLAEAAKHDVWPARPSGLCGWCAVGGALCEHWVDRNARRR